MGRADSAIASFTKDANNLLQCTVAWSASTVYERRGIGKRDGRIATYNTVSYYIHVLARRTYGLNIDERVDGCKTVALSKVGN